MERELIPEYLVNVSLRVVVVYPFNNIWLVSENTCVEFLLGPQKRGFRYMFHTYLNM